ncbi:YuiB family protein [Bacillus sp. Marseille-P3800]|uniref:YuiB family protein n=1 Tax=Bacillus sp. Marseille-P3800 TaxID=2014782 RepID=UPI000C07F93D|nr:YuiB family protein [Bacillus sp. Marseille-P3800]
MEGIHILQLIVSIILFFILFAGIGFLLNMVLRLTWIMAFIYPIVVLLIVNQQPYRFFFQQPGEAFSQLFERVISLHFADIVVLTSGFVGAIAAGIIMKLLRKAGYQMF